MQQHCFLGTREKVRLWPCGYLNEAQSDDSGLSNFKRRCPVYQRVGNCGKEKQVFHFSHVVIVWLFCLEAAALKRDCTERMIVCMNFRLLSTV